MQPSRRQGIFWICTVPHYAFTPYHVPGVQWLSGQLELGAGGFLHWQFVLALSRKGSCLTLRELFGNSGHYELTKSSSANEYVHKEDTRVQGTTFEFGSRSFNRSSKHDWDSIWASAVAGRILDIPASVRVQSYSTLRRIGADHARPVGMVRTCNVYWGATGTGKSRRAWYEAGDNAYPKDPRSKFWCGYSGQPHVVLDEFRGGIDASHLLRWLDRYPTIVEVKGSSCVLAATTFWITSNLPPHAWFPDLDHETYLALERRLNVINMI